MQILHTVEELRRWSRSLRCTAESPIGLVPTMGALHNGHASLIRSAAQRCPGRVAVSIFVNPTQFGPNEDFARYPRTFPADCEIAERAGATVIFAPSVEEMYPPGASTPNFSLPPNPTWHSLDRKTLHRSLSCGEWLLICASRQIW